MSEHTLVALACPGAGTVDTQALDPETGTLSPIGRVEGLDGAAALAVGPDGTLYAGCNGTRPTVVDLGPDGARTAAGDGEARERELPASTCFITVAPGGRDLYSASYGSGRLDRVPLPGTEGGAARTYETGQNAHCAVVSPDGRFLYATSLGDDRISWFPADGGAADDGVRTPSGHVAAEPGSGPRYLRLNGAGDRAYVVHELSGTIAVYAREAEDGRLELLQRVSAVEGLGLGPGAVRSSTSPDPGPRVIWAADLRLTPDGRFLYTTERSSSTLACFAVREGGLLELVGRIGTETQPAGAAIDPSGRFLLVCGEVSAHVTCYRIGDDGSLATVSRAGTSAGPVAVECWAGA